jgi:hypothetical protein
VTVVQNIIRQYYPSEISKVSKIEYEEDEPGLDVTSVGTGPTTRGRITVGRYFVENTNRRHFARRVLQTGHELQHIDQWRSGMAGSNRQNEREFLAFHREALAPELPGTGRVSHATRRTLIDAALGYYYCLDEEKQKEYAQQRQELLARREIENRSGGNEPTEPPTSCRRQ